MTLPIEPITDPGITREEALTLFKNYIKTDNLISHGLASEAIMRALALHFDASPDVWGIAGLLHDLDFEILPEDDTNDHIHGAQTAEILAATSIAPLIIDVIKKHNAEGLGLSRTTVFEHALTCAESITGLIVATALVYPNKKLSSVKPKSILKRMKTPHFARAVSRERIKECELIAIPLADFVALSLNAMQEIADQIGL